MNTTSDETNETMGTISSTQQQQQQQQQQHVDDVVTPDSGDRRVTQQTVMFLRLTYWLNNALSKSVNAGMYAFTARDDDDAEHEPCVMLVNGERKVFCLTRNEWNGLVLVMNDVSINVDTKRKHSVFIPPTNNEGEEEEEEGRSSVVITVGSMFGKLWVTLFKFDPENTPFRLTEKEWYAMVNHTPNISEHLNLLQKKKVSINERIRHGIAAFSQQTDDTVQQLYDRLAEEVNAFMRQARNAPPPPPPSSL